MASKAAQTNGSHRRGPARKTVGAKPSRCATTSRSWRKVLERNLIREGYSPAEAKELVAISAA
jgi:hypothetical protein